MILGNRSFACREEWEQKRYQLPHFDRQAISAQTKKTPQWIHFGAGNIFRAFLAKVWQDLLEKGVATTGLIVAEGFDYEIVDKTYRPFDDTCVLATLKADGAIEKTLIASVTESLVLD
ncbi:MAG: mannitol dehydrogenase family protein, partial [Clostridium sp.]|nr:mannitol dehydrogenase family protein [Clostridium sp.]